MLGFTLGASPLSKLLLVQEFVLAYQTSELLQSRIPHHCQLLPLSCPSAESHLISITNLCLQILLLPNSPFYSSHLLLFLLLTLSVLLGFFSSASQGRCREEHCKHRSSLSSPPCVSRREELSSCLCCPVPASPHAAGVQQGIPPLQTGARVICPGWGCLQLCQNLGGKRTAAAGTAPGDKWAQQTPPGKHRATWVGCMQAKQSWDILNIFSRSMTLSVFFSSFPFSLLFNWKKKKSAANSASHKFQRFSPLVTLQCC